MSSPTRPCEICNQPIDPERLEAVPDTRLCGDHARKTRNHEAMHKLKEEYEQETQQ